MKRLLIFLCLLSGAAVAHEHVGHQDTVNAGVTMADRTYVQKWKCLYKAVLDSMIFYSATPQTNDTAWGVVYSCVAGEPGTQLFQTDVSLHDSTSAARGFKQLPFPASCTLQANTWYFIGIDNRVNAVGARTMNVHSHQARAPVYFYQNDTSTATWTTASDVMEADVNKMPFCRLAVTPFCDSAGHVYDTVEYTVVDTLDKCNYMRWKGILNLGQNLPNRGAATVVRVGFDDNGTNDSIMRGLMAFGTNVAARNTDIQATADIIIYDSIRIALAAAVTGSEAGWKDIWWLKDSVKIWVEGTGTGASVAESLECTGRCYKAQTEWINIDAAILGAISSYNAGFIVDSFRSYDTSGHPPYMYYGSDSSNAGCDGWMRVADSIMDSAWSFGAGLFVKARLESGTDVWLDLGSDDNATAANRPIMYYKFLDIVEVDTTTVVGGWDTRHGNPTRHGATRH